MAPLLALGKREPVSIRPTVDPANPGGMLVDHMSIRDVALAARVTTSTVQNWLTVGCPGLDGKRHVLSTVRIGGRRYTHKADFAAFLDALNARS